VTGKLVLLDVGQGDAILLHDTESNSALIVDCALKGARRARSYLRDHAIDDVLGVVVTHLDTDHYAGIPELMRTVTPKTVAMNMIKGFRDSHPSLQAFVVQMAGQHRKKNFAILAPRNGDTLGDESGAIHVQFLAPTDAEKFAAQQKNDANGASTVARVRVGGLVALLPSDSPATRWRRLIDDYPQEMRADVFVLPHHGGPLSNDDVPLETILDHVGPRVIAISVGARNSYGHPDLTVLRAAGKWAVANRARLICTQLNDACAIDATETGNSAPDVACAGTVVVRSDGDDLKVEAEVSDHAAIVAGLAAPRCKPAAVV
jgi:competence protein ComEC